MNPLISNPFIDKHLQAKPSTPEPAGPIQPRRKRGRPAIDYPSTQSPTIGEIQQAALFYEGEGSYLLRMERVTIGQNDREKLDWMQCRFGGKVYGPYTNAAGNDTYTWLIKQERALGFMFTIFTFLSQSRREQFKTGNRRESQLTISDNGISEAFVKRNLEHSIKRPKGKMGLFGVRR